METPALLRGRLSPRQIEVLDGILAGKPNKVIAQDLILSTRTVEAHRAAIMSKVGVSSVAQLVRATSLSSDSHDSLDKICSIYPGLVSFWDIGLIARFANPLHETFVGKPVDGILGRSMNEVWGTSWYRRTIPFIRGVLAGQPQQFIQIMHLLGGRAVTFCAVFAPQFDVWGHVNGFFAFMTDIRTLDHDAWSAGRRPEPDAKLAEMMLDEESRIVSVNDTFTDITRYGAAEVRGQTPLVMKPLGVEPSAFMKFWADVQAVRQWEGMVWYRRRDGYLFRSRQRVSADTEKRGQVGCRVLFSEIKIG
jgi:DNA-binding CsgD family transcriptional regulator